MVDPAFITCSYVLQMMIFFIIAITFDTGLTRVVSFCSVSVMDQTEAAVAQINICYTMCFIRCIPCIFIKY